MAKVTSQLSLSPSVLDRLIDEDPRAGSYDFQPEDFRNPQGLAAKLRDGADPLSAYLRDNLLEETREELARFDESHPVSESLQHQLATQLTHLIKTRSIYESRRFQHIRFTKDTLKLIDQSMPGTVSVPLNRTLLEESYPDDIWKRRRESTSYTVNQLKSHVSRDLANLLNTRQELVEESEVELKEARQSVLTYGLPDFSPLSLVSDTDRRRIRRSVEQAIAACEPRLRNVRVSLDAPVEFDQVLRFRIEGLLRVEPAPEIVTFDAILRMSTQEYSVKG